jgi:hypothetical protein
LGSVEWAKCAIDAVTISPPLKIGLEHAELVGYYNRGINEIAQQERDY